MAMLVKKIISVLLILAICLSMLFTLSGCVDEKEHKCLKCNGSGVVRDKYGYYAYVDCPRCHGAGYLIY